MTIIEPVQLAGILAWFFAVWNLLVAGWIVFLADRRSALLSAIGITKGLLGGTVYLLVRRPPWKWYIPYREELVPFAVVLVMIFSVLVTVLIWQHYELEPPPEWGRRHYRECRSFFLDR